MNTSWHDRKATQTAEKERIARRVASEIPDGATLFIDIGTTPEAVAHALLGHNDLRIVTNNLNVANTLMVKDDFRIILAGGELRSRDGGIIGGSHSGLYLAVPPRLRHSRHQRRRQRWLAAGV